MTFGDALERMKAGQHVTRSGWPWPDSVRAEYTDDMQTYLVVEAPTREPIPYVATDIDIFANLTPIIKV